MPAERAQLLELAERVEKAEGEDRELDSAIGVAIGLPMKDLTGKPGWHGLYFVGRLPAFTSSLDAALTLVPEGLMWRLQHDVRTVAARVLTCDDRGRPNEIWRSSHIAKTPALALCAASLRALAAQPQEEGSSDAG